MWAFADKCDEFSLATRLFFKLDLNPTRETLLHFLEQVRRAFPELRRFRRREDGGVVLDEESREGEQRRYLRISGNSLRFGSWSPQSREAVASFAKLILTHAPYHFSLSDLDYDSLEVSYAFDLEYAGNHDELVAETLLADSPVHSALLGGDRRVIDCQPCVGFALSDDCATQAYIDIRGRTTMYELRTGEYQPQMLGVHLTLRRFFRSRAPGELAAEHTELLTIGERLAVERVVPQIVQPLREAIASRR